MIIGGPATALALRLGIVGCLSSIVLSQIACGVPNLRSEECSEAREAARRFYSFHFGNDMVPSPDALKLREQFLTPEYFSKLAGEIGASGEAAVDPFTYPSPRGMAKAFRIGSCKQITDSRVDMQVQFYWRDDESSDQEEFHADMVNRNGEWRVNQVGTGIVP